MPAYLLKVGHQLAPLQITRGGPIIMVQVENEYGSYGKDRDYLGKLRDDLKEAGFDVPLFTCDGPVQLKNDVRDDLFAVVNFGSNPEENFKALRDPPDGAAHVRGILSWVVRRLGRETSDRLSAKDRQRAGLHARKQRVVQHLHGSRRHELRLHRRANSPPYRPQTTSYDYDAPITKPAERRRSLPHCAS